MASPRIRNLVNWIFAGLSLACVGVVLIPLVSILYTALVNGGGVISVHFLTAGLPPGLCQRSSGASCPIGGIGPLIGGTLVLVALASAMAVPLGILVGIFTSEYGGYGVGKAVSFFTDVMTGLPSIVVGVFVYGLFVLYYPTIVFSAITGSIALAIIMVPIVARTSEESLRAVPHAIREATLGLGIPKYRGILRVVLPSALPAVLTGALLAVMRAGGEAAPLLLTAFGNRFGFVGFGQPVGAIPPIIFEYGQAGPGSNWQADAWGGALILIVLMLGISVLARLVLRNRFRAFAGG
ncbi:MAG: phosphate ABC transporter permease PstA [Thermoplasmata archaeon]|nr:phosphate ABC transporter permease PstA [Thermoplasmata archaeon]